MKRFNFYFQDLRPEAQSRILQELEHEFLAQELVEPRAEEESEEEFRGRVDEVLDDYLNRNNLSLEVGY